MTELIEQTHKMIEELLQFVDVPESRCSCHISPPCNDCVDYSYERGLIEDAKALIKQLKMLQLVYPKG